MSENTSFAPFGPRNISMRDPADRPRPDSGRRSLSERAREWFDWFYELDDESPSQRRHPRRRRATVAPRKAVLTPHAIVVPGAASPPPATAPPLAFAGAAGASESDLRFALASALAARTAAGPLVATYARWLLNYRYPPRPPLAVIDA